MVSGGKGSAGAWLSSVQRRDGREGQERKGRAGEGSGAAWSFRCCAFKDASMYQMRG